MDLFIEQAGENDAELRRSRTIIGHILAPALASCEPSNSLSISLTAAQTGAETGSATVRIGDVSLVVPRPVSGLSHCVPALYLSGKGQENQDVLRTLRFMLQKDALGQDVYLIGPPGPLRRRIAMKYAELTKRTVEYVALSQDTTESDLKQRREISQGTAKYVDCSATRAAINGSLLILDGIEKAERNVLVVLNNLLENREMALEDGRFLVSPKRYDALLKEHSQQELESWRLVRTSDRFRVVALGLPVPRYVGSALDPPFRSRFQARDVQGPRTTDQLNYLLSLAGKAAPEVVLRSLVQAAAVIREMRESDGTSVSPTSGLPEFPQGFEEFVGDLYSCIPELGGSYVASFLFPHMQLLKGVSDDRLHIVSKVFRRFALEDAHADKGYADGLGEPEDSIREQMAAIKTCSRIRMASIKLNKDRTEATVDFQLTIETPMDSKNQAVLDVTERVVSIKKVRAGGSLGRDPAVDDVFVSTDSTDEALTRMCLAHACDADICMIGEKGGGKSRLTAFFARLFGYRTEHIPLYKDVSARQLLQRRSTLSNGDTIWEDSALVRAALTGRLAVLDGIEQMVPGTLATLQELVNDRECRLPDGRRLVSLERLRYICQRDKLTEQELRARGVEVIHPSFRIIALARPANLSGTSAQQARGAWLLPELQTMFRFVYLNPMPPKEQATLIHSIAPNVTPTDLDKFNRFALALREAVRKDETLSALESTVSLRQTARVCRRLSSEEGTGDKAGVLRKALLSAALDRFLPPLTRDAFHAVLDQCGIVEDAEDAKKKRAEAFGDVSKTKSEDNDDDDDGVESWRIRMLPAETPGAIGVLKVGSTTRVDVFPPRDPLLVPSIVFFDNPRQTAIMAEMLRDWKSGQHLLLIGNQGVGKNKLADRMLQLLQLPREYIQLHRDTTVQNLTSNPTIVNGRLMYEDSPLVRAAREGRVLVVDEADKAPTYVTAVLKALVEDRSMLLSDGRRVVDASHVCETKEEEAEIIRLHPEFRVIALANRPGFPFHGNDFFREVGDVFACHAIDNPDFESEIYLMREYGPSVPMDALRRLVAAFDELRTLSDEGKLSYPYSTRELAAVVKHMERFPSDGIDKILRNVFDFDNYSQDEREILVKVFAKHGIPFSLGNDAFQVKTGLNRNLRSPKLLEFWEDDAASPAKRAAFASVVSFPACSRFNHGSGTNVWKLRVPTEMGMLQLEERSGQIFSEERYTFKLPRCSVLGCCQLADGKLVVLGRSSTFTLHLVDKTHTQFQSYDVFAAMPSDGTYRTSPKVASVVPLGLGDWVIVSHQDNAYLLAIDLGPEKSLLFFEQLPGVVKGGGKLLLCDRAVDGKILYYQRAESSVGVLDFKTQRNFQVKLDFFVEDAFVTGPNQWIVVEKGTSAAHVLRFVSEGEYVFTKIQKRDQQLRKVAIGNAKIETLAMERLQNPPGAVKDARAVLYTDGSVGFAAELPPASGGDRARFYKVEESENLADRGPVRAIRGLNMSRSQLFAVARERVDVFQIDLDVYDLETGKFRSLIVNLEDDPMSQSPASLKNFTQPGVLNRPLTSLSPSDLGVFSLVRQAISDVSQRIFLIEHYDGESLITIDCMGRVRVWYVTEMAIRRSFADWRKVVGNVGEADAFLNVTVEEEDENGNKTRGSGRGRGSGEGEGEGDGDGEGEGNGNGKGKGNGSGEGEGAGEGGNGDDDQSGKSQGKGGRAGQGGGSGTGSAKGKTKLEEVSELPDPGEFKATPLPNPAALEMGSMARGAKGGGKDEDPMVRAAAQELKKEEFEGALKKIGMTEFDAVKYAKYTDAVKTEIRELRSILDSLESKDTERLWFKNQTVGDLDDQKLIDGLTGDRSIYKRRKDADPDNPFFQPKPKRLSFVFDVSMSMSRYASDGRLERSLEAAVMVMEALKGFERKFDYRVVGHSGDTDELVLVPWGKPPKNDKGRLDVIRAMHAHTEMCDSGDHTLEAAKKAIFDCAAQPEADDRFVFLLSDANLDQYSITPDMISRLFDLDKRVHVFVLFIASMRDSASSFAKKMPGNVFICLDKKELPKVMKRMFVAAASKGS